MLGKFQSLTAFSTHCHYWASAAAVAGPARFVGASDLRRSPHALVSRLALVRCDNLRFSTLTGKSTADPTELFYTLIRASCRLWVSFLTSDPCGCWRHVEPTPIELALDTQCAHTTWTPANPSLNLPFDQQRASDPCCEASLSLFRAVIMPLCAIVGLQGSPGAVDQRRLPALHSDFGGPWSFLSARKFDRAVHSSTRERWVRYPSPADLFLWTGYPNLLLMIRLSKFD